MFEIEIAYEQTPTGWIATFPGLAGMTEFGETQAQARFNLLERMECSMRQRAEAFYMGSQNENIVRECVVVIFHMEPGLETPDTMLPPMVHPGDYKLVRKYGTSQLFRLSNDMPLRWGWVLIDVPRDERGYLLERYWSLPRVRPEDLEVAERV
jgi:hypothetical protein